MSNEPSLRLLLSPTSGVPLYRQLMDQLRAEIYSGRLEAGAMLPSVRQVAQDLSINPMTVSKAYSLLEGDGVLERVRGQGMRVLAPAGAERLEKAHHELVPLLRDALERARRLGLRREEVLTLLAPLLKELDHD
jgi:GntR family transcriptional regulator